MPEAEAMRHELETFSINISDSGVASFSARGAKAHDDLVLALAIAIWWLTRRGEVGGAGRVWVQQF